MLKVIKENDLYRINHKFLYRYNKQVREKNYNKYKNILDLD